MRKSHKKRKNKTFVRASSFEDVVCADSKYLVGHSCLTFNSGSSSEASVVKRDLYGERRQPADRGSS